MPPWPCSRCSHLLKCSTVYSTFHHFNIHVCLSSLLSGGNVRWQPRMLPPGKPRWACQRDRRADGRTPDCYITLSSRRGQRNNKQNTFKYTCCGQVTKQAAGQCRCISETVIVTSSALLQRGFNQQHTLNFDHDSLRLTYNPKQNPSAMLLSSQGCSLYTAT